MADSQHQTQSSELIDPLIDVQDIVDGVYSTLNEDIDHVVPRYEDIMRILNMCDHVRSACGCLVRHAVCHIPSTIAYASIRWSISLLNYV